MISRKELATKVLTLAVDRGMVVKSPKELIVRVLTSIQDMHADKEATAEFIVRGLSLGGYSIVANELLKEFYEVVEEKQGTS